jgi:hypothetical protein
LAGSLPVTVRRRILVWNKVRNGIVPKPAEEVLSDVRFEQTILLPADEGVAQLSTEERSVLGASIPEAFYQLMAACVSDPVETVATMRG